MVRKIVMGAMVALVLAMGAVLIAGCSSGSGQSAASSVAASSAPASSAPASSEPASAASSEPASASSEPAKADFEPLAVSYLNKAFYEDIIVANSRGDYADAGPEISLFLVDGSGKDSVEAMLAGSVDVAATGQGPVADAIKEHGDDIVILAGANCWTAGQIWVAGPAMTGDAQLVAYDKAADNKAEVKASFESAAAAKGGPIRIGVQQGATTESVLKSWLKAMDISCADFADETEATVKLVDVKANLLPTTLATGTDIDVMAASKPYPDIALRELEGSYKIGGDDDINSYNIELFITTKDVYEKKADSIKAWLKADQATIDWMNANQAEAIAICAESMGLTEEEAGATFETADFNIALSDQMLKTLAKTCEKKEVEITEDQLKEQMPLYDWISSGMQD